MTPARPEDDLLGPPEGPYEDLPGHTLRQEDGPFRRWQCSCGWQGMSHRPEERAEHLCSALPSFVPLRKPVEAELNYLERVQAAIEKTKDWLATLEPEVAEIVERKRLQSLVNDLAKRRKALGQS